MKLRIVSLLLIVGLLLASCTTPAAPEAPAAPAQTEAPAAPAATEAPAAASGDVVKVGVL
jgi:PBP1b-binding outer membrane lipoprotein LpoB